MGFVVLGIIVLFVSIIISTNLSDKQLQYEQIKAIKELATSQNSKVVLMGSGKGGNIILDAK